MTISYHLSPKTDYTILSNAAGRDKTLVSIKNDKRAELRTLLAELADYVTSVCNGDRTMLLSSGFDLARQRGEVPLQAITRPTVSSPLPT
jgi:hypothetical protein